MTSTVLLHFLYTVFNHYLLFPKIYMVPVMLVAPLVAIYKTIFLASLVRGWCYFHLHFTVYFFIHLRPLFHSETITHGFIVQHLDVDLLN